MSADNFIAIWSSYNHGMFLWYVAECQMYDIEDEQSIQNFKRRHQNDKSYLNRSAALIDANIMLKEYFVEYGIMEIDTDSFIKELMSLF